MNWLRACKFMNSGLFAYIYHYSSHFVILKWKKNSMNRIFDIFIWMVVLLYVYWICIQCIHGFFHPFDINISKNALITWKKTHVFLSEEEITCISMRWSPVIRYKQIKTCANLQVFSWKFRFHLRTDVFLSQKKRNNMHLNVMINWVLTFWKRSWQICWKRIEKWRNLPCLCSFVYLCNWTLTSLSI